MLSIAQITDLHVTTGEDPLNQMRNEQRLRQVLRSVHELKPRPVAIIASGDLVDHGHPEEYAALKAILAEAEIPIYYAVGNHDRRGPFLDAFGGPFARCDPNGFIQYAVDFDGLRMVVCDTLEEGRDRSGFDAQRADWLAETLAADTETPTIVVMHHPPILSGVRWMDPDPNAPWIGQLADVIRGHDQIRAVLCGHVHRAFHGLLAGHVVTTSPATSIQVTLNLSPVDMERPDGREILVAEPPGYVLVVADEGRVTTHTCVAGQFEPAVAYTRPFGFD
ncbi:MAG TPA: phosphodiesterase [Phenylobacterium sp.]|uniref:phosphodiesterase n=1 Tax=Phenylobacterium sp. TaxID=1871053 RepID=UPI002C6F94C2|nr:phosphodiesterase [Phenylobacterium sp.]HXA40670.1 phosphodiesterase [Phenylobacterium sp.]